ncbi:class I SAM-dependent methyltransferase [Aspergillus affinis]|uniref:class I SAM-dependent methyltransferase n=1 Tax=Aspergillus affinis TaxID=1070780 RepID=UPI0022FE3180|nr:S-adenosyl-L-methionine-dependent methyltransferase [Aspergillus affinis]KAI9036026.1 S-adenosyl-L-methionine-dependent methyltransferase [Aspergillus affinis]
MSTPPPEDGYTLRRNYMSSMRLNAQHYLWKDAVGSNLHPAIPVPNKGKDVRIADIGTGTGIWMTDISREYPAAEIDGFDVSFDQCPQAQWLPKNTSLRYLDLYQSLPDDLHGVYDIIHLRLFLVVIRDDDPVPVLRNLVKMLKPGGWIQWADHNLDSWTVETIAPDVPSPAMEKMRDMMVNTGLGRWVPRLHDTFSEQGLIDVRKDFYPIAPHSRLYWSQLQLNSNEEYSYLGMDNSTQDAVGPQYRNLIAQAAEEGRNGAAFNFTLEVTIGRKAA